MNGADFAAFAVDLGKVIFHGVNWKMVSEFHVICQNGGFKLFWGDTWIFGYIVNSANGADFATFIF